MPYEPEVKERAYALDPEAWVSYSGWSPEVKRVVEVRRTAALRKAQEEIDAERVEEAVNENPSN